MFPWLFLQIRHLKGQVLLQKKTIFGKIKTYDYLSILT